MGAAKRRRRQFAIGFRHIARIGRPIYKRRQTGTVGQAVERERAKAYAEARRKVKRKK